MHSEREKLEERVSRGFYVLREMAQTVYDLSPPDDPKRDISARDVARELLDKLEQVERDFWSLATLLVPEG